LSEGVDTAGHADAAMTMGPGHKAKGGSLLPPRHNWDAGAPHISWTFDLRPAQETHMPRPRLAVLASLAALCLASTSALAADIAATSRIDAVTVFPQGAEITRLAKVAIAQGEHTVVLSDLPAQALPGSIRVEGKATGRLDIGSVDTRRLRLQRADSAAAAAERRRIEDEIEKARDQRAALQAQIDTAQTQKTFITNLAELPKRPPAAPGQPARQDDWTQLLTLIGTSMAEVHRAILDTQGRIREVDRRITDLERRLAALAPAPEERTEVKVNVGAAAALEADLTITYQVPNASWQSLYDARLMTGTRTTTPKLQLTRRAAISQRTGESWESVRLALSTTRPTAGTSAPVLNPMTVDFEADRPPPPPRPVAPMSAAPPAGRSAALGGAAEDLRREKVAEERARQDVPVQQQQAQLEQAPFQAVFTTHGRTTIPNTGETKRVFVQEEQLDPVLVVQTVPKLDARAYLYAKLTMPRGAPYLPGPVSLFRDATFVGTGQLPLLSPGQEHELGFGIDDNIVVRHAIAEEKRGETGVISSSRTDLRNFRISVRSRHERPLFLSIRDQIPASLNNDIKVELIARQPPTRRDLDDKRGTIAWEGEIKPDEERVIDFGWRITWPANKALTYGR
jgi:uncharacterized protein (TIGR02231 family)